MALNKFYRSIEHILDAVTHLQHGKSDRALKSLFQATKEADFIDAMNDVKDSQDKNMDGEE